MSVKPLTLEKRCPGCSEVKLASEYHRRGNGVQTYCKLCTKQKDAKRWKNLDGTIKMNRRSQLRANYAKHGSKYRERQHLSKFGITLEERDLICKAQSGKCAACGDALVSRTRHGLRSAFPQLGELDHNHSTGKIRGLLCLPCNTALGLLRDDVGRILRLLEYRRLDA